jgi:hypothetical protein
VHKSDIKKQEQQIIDSINEENRILEKKKEMAMHLYRQILEKVSVLRICPIIHENSFCLEILKFKILYNLIIFLLYCDNRPDIFYKEYIKNIN